MIRLSILQQLAKRIIALHHTHPLRIAIDGIDAADKTTLANELAPLILRFSSPYGAINST